MGLKHRLELQSSFVHIMAARLGRRILMALHECFLLFVIGSTHCLHADN
jgi:hypothetical protein